MTFRRFVITKTLLLLSGRSSVINPGARFCSTPSNPIAAYMSLGPLLFAEFCAHCYDCEQTSIAPKNSSSFQASDLSLTQLALRAFSFCVHGMTNGTMNHAMSKAQRVHFLMSNSIMTASRATPSSKDGWDYYKALDSDAARIHGIDVSHDELQLQRTLLPFVSYNASPAEGNGDSPTRICLFAELLQESMHGECVEFCHLVMAAANAFSEPNIREHLGIMMLRCFEHRKGEEVVGVLGLDHGEDSRADACSSVSSAIKVAFRLNHDLDGDAVVPIPLDFLGLDLKRKGSLRVARSKMGLPCFTLDNWPEKHRERLVKELSSSDGCPGTVQQVAWALTGTLGIDTPFIKLFSGRESPLSKQVKLACIKTASKLPEPIFAKEKTSISNMISAAIESGLNNADYVTLKLIPHMSGNSLDFAQRFVSCLLMSVSKVICASAPSAAYVDINGSFASTLLKSTKKLYGVLARLILSYSNNPQSLASKENRSYFDYVSSTLMSRVAALLYTIQEKHETSVGKFLAESKIESHGKISALLVFEKEKLDNALLKVGARLKQAGFEDDSEWLEEHVVASLNRDFDIKKGDIQNAKEREAPKKKRNPAEKRKAKPKSSPKKKKKVKKEKNETPVAEVISSDVEEDDIADGGDASSDGDDGFESEGGDVVSLGNLTNDMGDDDDCSDEDMEDGDDCEEDSESEDELESD